MLALQQEVTDIRNEAVGYGSLGNVPADDAGERAEPDVPGERDAATDAEAGAEDEQRGYRG